jgi:hypothetical protein
MKGVEHNPHGGATFTGEGITMLRETMMLRCLKMEIKGIKMVRHSVYAQVKREFGFKGSKEKVLQQLIDHIKKQMQEKGATEQDIDAMFAVGKL